MWMRRSRSCCALASSRAATASFFVESGSLAWTSRPSGLLFTQSRHLQVRTIDAEKTVEFGHHTALVEVDPTKWKVPKDWSEVDYPPKITQLAHQVLSLNVIENLLLMRYIMKKKGLTEDQIFGGPQIAYAAAAPGAQVAAPAAAAPPEEAKPPEKTEFKLVLTAVPADAKVKILKEVRVLKPGMKLLESKDLVEKLPSILKENVPKEEAESWITKFKEAGATLELQ